MTVERDHGDAPIRAIDVRLLDQPPTPDALLLAPRPFDHWGQRLDRIDVDNVGSISEIGSGNSECRALLMTQAGGDAPRLRYAFRLVDAPAPSWVWRVQRNRFTTADPNLCALAKEVVGGETSQRNALRKIIDSAAGVFNYDHVDEAFNEGSAAVPTVCGTTKGNCVDINTYILAAALSLGIKGQYVAGYWFHPNKTETADMHCWLAFHPDDAEEPIYWDLAHALKWAATLGAEIREGLNPAGGRRVGMSCGRGLTFETPHGAVEISHFSEPVWVLPGGELRRPELQIGVDDPVDERAAQITGDAA